MASRSRALKPRLNDVAAFVSAYAPCQRAVDESLQYRSSMHEAWEKSKNGDWLVWILDRLEIPHAETAAIRTELFREVNELRAAVGRFGFLKASASAARAPVEPATPVAEEPALPAARAAEARRGPQRFFAGSVIRDLEERRLARAERNRASRSRPNRATTTAQYKTARRQALAAFAQRIRATIPNPFTKG